MQYRVSNNDFNKYLDLFIRKQLYFNCCPPRLEDYLQKPDIPEEHYVKELNYRYGRPSSVKVNTEKKKHSVLM
jgi:hypothetical protein